MSRDSSPGPAPTGLHTLSLHAALPIFRAAVYLQGAKRPAPRPTGVKAVAGRYLSTQQRSRDATRSRDRKSTRLNSSHANISYAVFCLKKKKKQKQDKRQVGTTEEKTQQ